jgi:hypothetical protein
MARSKSSLVASRVHDTTGSFLGTLAPSLNHHYPRGQFENQKLKRLIRFTYGEPWRRAEKGQWPDPKPDFQSDVLRTLRVDGYTGGPWQHKTSALNAPYLLEAFPQALVICVRRRPEKIVQSARRHGGPVPPHSVLHAHEAELDRLAHAGAWTVWPEENPDQLEDLCSKLLAFCVPEETSTRDG